MNLLDLFSSQDSNCKDFQIGTPEKIWAILSSLLHVILIFIETFMLYKFRLFCNKKNKYELIKMLIIVSFLIMSLCMLKIDQLN